MTMVTHPRLRTTRAGIALGVSALLLSGCFGRNDGFVGPVKYPVYDAPMHIFADPIGYHYPPLIIHQSPMLNQPLARDLRPNYPSYIPRPAAAPQPAPTPVPFDLPQSPDATPPPAGPSGSGKSGAIAPDLAPALPSLKQTILRPARERALNMRTPGPLTTGAVAQPAADVVHPSDSDDRPTIAARRQ